MSDMRRVDFVLLKGLTLLMKSSNLPLEDIKSWEESVTSLFLTTIEKEGGDTEDGRTEES